MTLQDENRRDMIKHHLQKSETALESAAKLLETDIDGAANRAYYSIFHSEKALLLTKGISGDSHKHVHTSLSKEFVREGLLPPETSKKIHSVENMRNIADYSSTESLTKELAEKAVSRAEEFFEETKKIIAQYFSPNEG